MSVTAGLNPDFLDLLSAFERAAVQIVVGAHALAANGIVRGDGRSGCLGPANDGECCRVVIALRDFGALLAQQGVTGRLCGCWLSRRIDVLTQISGVEFAEAWADRTSLSINGATVAFLGRDALIKNERAAGRPKDLLDAELLERQPR